MKKFHFKKIILVSGLTIFVILILFLVYNKKSSLAQEELPVICESGSPPENELQIPIGQAIDQTEHLARRIASEVDGLLAAEAVKLASAIALSELPKECKAERCTPKCEDKPSRQCRCQPGACVFPPYYSCTLCNGCITPQDPYSCCWDETGCAPDKCTAESSEAPCPYGEINASLNEVLEYARVVRQKYDEIVRLDGIMKTEVLGKLLTARKRLARCVIYPEEEQLLERGEIAGRALMSCQTIMNESLKLHSVLDGVLQEGCYGNLYCYVQVKEKGLQVPYPPPPCAEDYFCCY